jgi:hypothetical protein
MGGFVSTTQEQPIADSEEAVKTACSQLLTHFGEAKQSNP